LQDLSEDDRPAEHVGDDGFSPEESVVVATGDIDIATAPKLWQSLAQVIDAGHGLVVLDMSGIEFMDSQGIAVIGRAHKRLQARGGAVVIRSPRPQPRRVLEITGLAQMIQVED
jgi:anti-anti-sigma factor